MWSGWQLERLIRKVALGRYGLGGERRWTRLRVVPYQAAVSEAGLSLGQDIRPLDGLPWRAARPPQAMHWTLRLLANKVVELGLAPSMSHEGIRKRLSQAVAGRACRKL